MIKRGKGPYVYDYDGNRYTDFHMSYGDLVLGHSHPRVTDTLKSWLSRGYGEGYNASSQERLARMVYAMLTGGADLESDGGEGGSFGEHVFLFARSPDEAFVRARALLARAGYTGCVRCSPCGPVDGPLESDPDREWRTPPTAWAEFPWAPIDRLGGHGEKTVVLVTGAGGPIVYTRKEGDAQAGGPGAGGYVPPDAGELSRRILEAKERNPFLLILDEREFHGHALFREMPHLARSAEVRIVGSWAFAGLPVSCAILNAGVPGLDASLPPFEKAVAVSGGVPLCLAKAAIEGIGIFARSGGTAALVERYRAFAGMLEDRRLVDNASGPCGDETPVGGPRGAGPAGESGGRFLLCRGGANGSFVFLNEGPGRRTALASEILRKGILLPPAAGTPLALSFSHDNRVLEQSAGRLGSAYGRIDR